MLKVILVRELLNYLCVGLFHKILYHAFAWTYDASFPLLAHLRIKLTHATILKRNKMFSKQSSAVNKSRRALKDSKKEIFAGLGFEPTTSRVKLLGLGISQPVKVGNCRGIKDAIRWAHPISISLNYSFTSRGRLWVWVCMYERERESMCVSASVCVGRRVNERPKKEDGQKMVHEWVCACKWERESLCDEVPTHFPY